jgi:hypothetical protein
MGGIELLAEQSLEQPREHPHVQEEAAPAGDPLPVECNPAAGHDAVQMRVMGEGRAPSEQYRRQPDARPEVFWVRGDGEQGLRGGLEQQGIDQRLVVVGDGADRGRQGEDHMVVLRREQVGLTGGQPLFGDRP